MWFWWFMFVCDLLVPLVMAAGGWFMKNHAPKKINGLVGYRTRRSMQNEKTWKFAHECCGRLWWRLGWILLFLSASVLLPFRGQSENAIGAAGAALCMVQCAVLVLSIIPVERALKRRFNEDGTKK